MKEEDGIKMLQRLEFYVQKARSNMLEGFGIDDESDMSRVEMRVLVELHPWMYGEKNILLPLSKLNARIRGGQPLTAYEFYNMMWVVHLTPALQIMPPLMGADFEFPEPTPSLLTEWEPTEREDEIDMTDPGQMMAWYQKHKKESNDEYES